MGRYRKRPVVVEARQFTSYDTGIEIMKWVNSETPKISGRASDGEGNDLKIGAASLQSYPFEVLKILTREGEMAAAIGDFVIRGVQGEFYPCKPEIFFETYEAVP